MINKKNVLGLALAMLLFLPVTTVFACEEGDPSCEPIPVDSQEIAEDVTYTPETVTAVNGENSVMSGDLKVEDVVYEKTVAACADSEDVIYLNTTTQYDIGSITNVIIMNKIAFEYSGRVYTDEEAYIRGTQIDDVFGQAVTSGNYTELIRLIRDVSGNVPDNTIDWVGGDEEVSSFWGHPDNESSIQSLAFYLEQCMHVEENPIPDPLPIPPANPSPQIMPATGIDING